MDAHFLMVYLREIESQSLMATNAIGNLDHISATMANPKNEIGFEQRNTLNKEYFRSVHSFLTHLSNMSRLLWPPALSPKQNCFCGKPKANGMECSTCVARERSSQILNALGLQGADHIIKNRTLRDHLEHFDERIDHWMKTSKNRNFVQDIIGPKGGIMGLDESDMMRQYDPATGTFRFRGETFSLVELFAGLNDLLARTRQALAKYEVLRRF
ncbi:hypothetical protein I5Q49_06315 [Pseudomonas carnis]|uniref:hypothetical protein n=1 Tax=Pseudomonas carnis TaxID=2487355 RepID=UPI0018D90FB1|nr:hypothetical protein [Pseudomonas carnis]MBH3464459.1 hypothetical protein [Pseudomonas carnis]